MKDNRGEISIQLVITIIILIVMAGICIFMLTGEDGLFVPKKDDEIIINNVNTNETNEQNITNNETQETNINNNANGELIVPAQ